MGGLFLGELVQAARARRENSCHKQSLRETSEVGVWHAPACGYYGGFDRALPARSASPRRSNQDGTRVQGN